MDLSRTQREPAQSGDTSAAAECAPQVDTGLWAMAGVALQLGVQLDWLVLAHALSLNGRKANGRDIVLAAAGAGLIASLSTGQDPAQLPEVARPAILRLRDGQYVIIGQRTLDRYDVFYFSIPHPVPLTTNEICGLWSGESIVISIDANAAPEVAPAEFGLRWFLPSLWRYRSSLGHVLLASFFLQLCVMVTPLFFQVVIDRALTAYSLSTSIMVLIALLLIGLFEVILLQLRLHALFHTVSRLDFELGSRVYDHLLKLPLSYFETHPTGQIVARVRETDTIRNFLTGQTVSSLLDVLFTLVFFAVLAAYSGTLTIVVLISVVLHVVVASIVRPKLRKKSQQRFLRSADNQQFLVESIAGMGTLKAAAIEPSLKNQWENKLARFIRTAFETNMVAALGQSCGRYLNRATTALILFLGAGLISAGEMTIGQLVAYNMFAGLVTAPAMRLSALWQEIQQIQVSIERLGDIMKAAPEPQARASVAPGKLRGEISIRDLYFSYDNQSPDVLHGISLDIAAGQVVGIVGASGSGKSTLTKLIQRLHVPQRGQILIDGTNIMRLHASSLRQQIGVVPQENLLFKRSIHDNIALAAPTLSREQVIEVARLAGAHEFISRLSQGYDTPVEEAGANLSGGQRQGIALARALVRNPRILILDEATSAIDYESERTLMANMDAIVRGRTVLIVAHRLATIRNCDRIVSMSHGRIVEDGTHEALLLNELGVYHNLWTLQVQAGRS